ncbi:BppU family phage baseplate upper protein [Clostridium sp. BL-8]|uniref:BppU family phage baseplate upper protein n=1 Tax=Clostridium sp. BL-8 TaxID=349938 RepID=UPI00098CC531|nr:BppU family phage baseplate upper protein [Clostridium sp. BL-8]OOM75505.1 hypothetical protein CLOBL_39950 [Clostridium sp. BL-8]
MQKNLYIPIDIQIKNIVECTQLVKRGDTLTLIIKVFNNAVLADLTSQSIDLILKKSDGKLIEKTITSVSNGVITATLDVQATNVAGIVQGEVQIYTSNTLSSTNTFTFNVDPSLADEVLEVSKDNIQVLADLRNLIEEGQVKIQEYENSVLAIGNSAEAIEALANIKLYIDTNLPALENENAKATVNINNLKTQNDKAPGLTTSLKTQNDAATSNISILTSKNTEAVTNKNNLESSNSTANATKSALDTSNTNATNTKNALNTSITNANNSKSALDTSKSNADASKVALDTSIEEANAWVAAHQNIGNLVEQVNSNTAQLSEKIELYIGETLPAIADRKKNTLYFKVTDTISTGTTENIKVSPTMGIKVI